MTNLHTCLTNINKVMIFGRPGSGKSTFAYRLATKTGLPLYHLDKYFFLADWVPRDYQAFMHIQETIVHCDQWIVDGNSTRSLETRWSHADLVLYFNYNKLTCLLRLIKRQFTKIGALGDRASGCPERLTLRLIQYMLGFDKRVKKALKH